MLDAYYEGVDESYYSGSYYSGDPYYDGEGSYYSEEGDGEGQREFSCLSLVTCLQFTILTLHESHQTISITLHEV